MDNDDQQAAWQSFLDWQSRSGWQPKTMQVADQGATYPSVMPYVRPPTATPAPSLLMRDPNFVPRQPTGNALMPFIPMARNIPDWLTGPPGSPQATDDPAFQRRFERTLPLPGVGMSRTPFDVPPWLRKYTDQ